MAEQWSEMEGRLRPSRSLEERLRDHPELRAKIESLLAVVENAAGDVEKAAEAERRVTEELRQLGSEALHGWARRQAQRKEEEAAQQPGVQRKEKTSIGRRGRAARTGIREWSVVPCHAVRQREPAGHPPRRDLTLLLRRQGPEPRRTGCRTRDGAGHVAGP